MTEVDYPGVDAFLVVTNGTTTPHIALGAAALPAANGGTGQTSLANAWTALYTAADAANDPLPIAAGGTGAETAAAARTALGADVIPETPIQSIDTTNRNFIVGASARMGVVEVTLTKAGRWLLLLSGQIHGTANSNVAADTEFHVSIYRTNNTPGDITNGEFVLYTGDIGTMSTLHTYGTIHLPLIYQTANADDNFQIYGYQVTALTGGGPVTLRNGSLIAVFLKD